MSRFSIICLKIAVLSLMLIGAVVEGANAMHGVSTSFADVILAGMKPGMIYSLREERNIPFGVINRAEERTEVEVLIARPRRTQMREGYEPIPDPGWVSVVPSNFILEPGERMNCDLIISIPPEEEYTERHFQAMIVTQTSEKPGEGGVQISFSLANRLRFSTGPRPETVLAEYRDRVLSVLEMEMMPMSLTIRERIPLGEKVIFDGFDYSAPQIVNRSRENYRLEFKVAENPGNYGVSRDYSPLPEDAEINLITEEMEVDARSIEDVVVEVTIPDREEYRGERFVFVVAGLLADFDIPIEIFSRVYFTTEE